MESYDHGVQTMPASETRAAAAAPTAVRPAAVPSPSPPAPSIARPSTRWRWNRLRLAAGMGAFWFISGIGAGLLQRAGSPSQAQGWRILVLLVSVVLCMVTERGDWNKSLRILFVLLTPFVEAFLELPFVLMMGPGLYLTGRGHLIDSVATFFSSLAILIFAMRQSQLFVRPLEQGPGLGSVGSQGTVK